MTLALNSKNKLGFVDGSITAPSPEIDPEGYASWSRCNDMVHSWIINTINPEISDSVIYYSTATEVWDDLRERFSQGDTPPCRGRPYCSHCGAPGHWIQTCYEIHGYPVGHPKGKNNFGSGPRRFTPHAANQVSDLTSKMDGTHLVGISETQLQQLLSLIDKKNEGSNVHNNAVTPVTKPGFSKIKARNWVIDSGATHHIASSSTLFCNNKKCALPPVLLPSGETAEIIAKGSVPLNTV